ncbi:MAG: choice-of-anchor Q domain-containing protein [Rudaea sp.]|nr:choice-of-anchor Q domain-containing protein [Rudaea sp.]
MQSTPRRLGLRHLSNRIGFVAGILTVVSSAHAHTYCADSAASLQAALTAASDNGPNDNEDNTIQIVTGTYNTADIGSSVFFSYSNQTTARKLDINGGYNNGCSAIIKNPELTILDGGGTTHLFESESIGDVSVRYLTFQNGRTANTDSYGPVEINTMSTSNGPVIFDQNIVRNNRAGFCDGGFTIFVSPTSTLQFENNLIVGNAAISCDGAGLIYDEGGAANIINNTFAQNSVAYMPTSATGGLEFYVSIAASPPLDTMSNNIFWANSGYDLETTAVLVNNEFSSNQDMMDPTSTGNFTADPQFSSSSDFHLLPTSPLLGQGTLTPTGGLPTIDIEGHPRSYNGHVDMGAYERGDEIFKDGYEG